MTSYQYEESDDEDFPEVRYRRMADQKANDDIRKSQMTANRVDNPLGPNFLTDASTYDLPQWRKSPCMPGASCELIRRGYRPVTKYRPYQPLGSTWEQSPDEDDYSELRNLDYGTLGYNHGVYPGFNGQGDKYDNGTLKLYDTNSSGGSYSRSADLSAPTLYDKFLSKQGMSLVDQTADQLSLLTPRYVEREYEYRPGEAGLDCNSSYSGRRYAAEMMSDKIDPTMRSDRMMNDLDRRGGDVKEGMAHDRSLMKRGLPSYAGQSVVGGYIGRTQEQIKYPFKYGYGKSDRRVNGPVNAQEHMFGQMNANIGPEYLRRSEIRPRGAEHFETRVDPDISGDTVRQMNKAEWIRGSYGEHKKKDFPVSYDPYKQYPTPDQYGQYSNTNTDINPRSVEIGSPGRGMSQSVHNKPEWDMWHKHPGRVKGYTYSKWVEPDVDYGQAIGDKVRVNGWKTEKTPFGGLAGGAARNSYLTTTRQPTSLNIDNGPKVMKAHNGYVAPVEGMAYTQAPGTGRVWPTCVTNRTTMDNTRPPIGPQGYERDYVEAGIGDYLDNRAKDYQQNQISEGFSADDIKKKLRVDDSTSPLHASIPVMSIELLLMIIFVIALCLVKVFYKPDISSTSATAITAQRIPTT